MKIRYPFGFSPFFSVFVSVLFFGTFSHCNPSSEEIEEMKTKQVQLQKQIVALQAEVNRLQGKIEVLAPIKNEEIKPVPNVKTSVSPQSAQIKEEDQQISSIGKESYPSRTSPKEKSIPLKEEGKPFVKPNIKNLEEEMVASLSVLTSAEAKARTAQEALSEISGQDPNDPKVAEKMKEAQEILKQAQEDVKTARQRKHEAEEKLNQAQ